MDGPSSGNNLNVPSNLQGPMQVVYLQNQQHPQQCFLVPHQQVRDVSYSGGLNRQESAQLKEWAKLVEVDLDASDDCEDFPWKRVKWTDEMARLLITALSYIGEGTSAETKFGIRQNLLLVPKIGKWKAISMVMVERGYTVSPQQCEDKFNDMNKKYKRLISILGPGTSCDIVENPTLLGLMDLPEREKMEAEKILSSKQLLYQELCSYHNTNQLHLPHDRELQRSLLLILKGKNEFKPNGELENAERSDDSSRGKYSKRIKLGEEQSAHEKLDFHPCNGNLGSDNGGLVYLRLQLEKKKLEMQEQKLELERQRVKWRYYCQKEDGKLDQLRMEIEAMKLRNACLAFELQSQRLSAHRN